jgi:hypothetical protein
MSAFDKLDLESKSEMLRIAGVSVITVTFFTYYVTLYILEGFLAERYYCTESKSIVKISTVQYPDLDKYLNHINISQLFGLFR